MSSVRPDLPHKHERDAARRYLEHDYTAHHLAGEPGRAADRNAAAIDEEHPRARDIALTGTKRELGELPNHLRRHQRESRRLAGIDSDDAARIRREYRTTPLDDDSKPEDRPSSRRERARTVGAAAAGRAGELATTAYDAASDTSVGQLLGEIAVGGFVLSIFYLFLTRAAATSKLFEGATNTVRALISPAVDPLNPKGALR